MGARVDDSACLENMYGSNVIMGSPLSSDVASRRMTGQIPSYKMFYYVYILHLGNKQLYTGFTEDLKRRILEHKKGKDSFTKNKQPVKLVHYEAYYLESDARRREKYLKTTEGKRFLKQQIRDFLNEELVGCRSGRTDTLGERA